MTRSEVSWLVIARDLGVRVVAPYAIQLAEENVTVAAFFPQFGGPSGMIADPDWSVLEPHKAQLVRAGVGYSCVDLGRSDHQSMREMLADWGWNDASGDKPDWL